MCQCERDGGRAACSNKVREAKSKQGGVSGGTASWTVCECVCVARTQIPHFYCIFSFPDITEAIPARCHGHSTKNFFKTLLLSATFLLSNKMHENPAGSQHPQHLSITCSPNIKAREQTTPLSNEEQLALSNDDWQTAALTGRAGGKKSQPPFHSQNLPQNICWEKNRWKKLHQCCRF